jgi:hypothetical protein
MVISGVKQAFVKDPEFISEYARSSSRRSGQVEDWAESVAYYCYALRRHGLLKIKGRRVLFEHLFPHRAQLIQAYLKSLDMDAQSISDRPQLVQHRHFMLPTMTFEEIIRQGAGVFAD